MHCRFCNTNLEKEFLSLGVSPLANSYLDNRGLGKKELFYPLELYVCPNCLLVQVDEFEIPENIFSDYAYFSSYSSTWLEHVEKYVNKMMKEYGIEDKSNVIEIASNDGYLLQYFKKQNVSVLGIEPAENVALVAEKKGVPTICKFFAKSLAEELVQKDVRADLLIGNNVLAHVPNLNDFISGMKILLNYDGFITMEFPHLLRLIKENQFDTIYHEHFSYFSFIVVNKILKKHGLEIFEVEEIPTHGGSLRIYAKHIEDNTKLVKSSVEDLFTKEKDFGIDKIKTYDKFTEKVKQSKRNILKFLIDLKNKDKMIVGYGAPAKGNTLLNYCGVGIDFLDYTVDKNPYKQGKYLPGTHIPIFSPEKFKETKPDYVIILPWNLKEEIIQQINYIKEWNGKFIVLIPEVEVL
ncbi:methyltransferase domain-containing protein [Halocella sp. SP3-1]|nr:methyltransferase domain-containing protein [Halocella sp. SP3-1]